MANNVVSRLYAKRPFQWSSTPTNAGYDETLQDLVDASVRRGFDPYQAIDWDDPELAVVPNDPRWILSTTLDPVGRSAWYQSLPQDRQIAIGMWRQANVAKVGLQFEQVLIRGLIQYSFRVENGSPEFAYVTHEAREECNHTLMFQEMVNRLEAHNQSGVQVLGMKKRLRRTSPLIGLAATAVPSLFFFGVLAGEEPIDHLQKQFLRSVEIKDDVHPMMVKVMQLHVAEEARHISFAHTVIRQRVPALKRRQRFILSLFVPLIMRNLASAILVPSKQFWKGFDIPREVKREIYWKMPENKETLAGVFGDVRMLADEVGLMNPISRLIWKMMRIGGRNSRFRSEPAYQAQSPLAAAAELVPAS